MVSNYIDVVDAAIADALLDKSKITDDIKKIDGFSSIRIKHFLNNLAAGISPVNYLEVGLFHGGSFISTLYNNNVNSAYGIDNYTECNGSPDILEQNLDIINGYKFKVYYEDCFKFDIKLIPDKINLYYYDADHSKSAQRNALLYYEPILDDVFIFCVDDWNWRWVREGTKEGLKNYTVLKDWEFYTNKNGCPDTWWNGFYIAVLKK